MLTTKEWSEVNGCCGRDKFPDIDAPMELLLYDARRISARDAKLQLRVELLADQTRSTKRHCVCNICMGEVCYFRFKAIVRDHLRQ